MVMQNGSFRTVCSVHLMRKKLTTSLLEEYKTRYVVPQEVILQIEINLHMINTTQPG